MAALAQHSESIVEPTEERLPRGLLRGPGMRKATSFDQEVPIVRTGGSDESVPTLHWCLRRASDEDMDALYALLCLPEVYRYLCDGAPPPRWRVEEWGKLNRAGSAARGLGLWLLQGDEQLAGAVCLETDSRPRTAELMYLLHPEFWGQGLATRSSWTIVERTFRERALDRIVAGADGANQASVAVMIRLGMQYQRTVQYPLGAGVEYGLGCDDPKPVPVPELVPRLE